MECNSSYAEQKQAEPGVKPDTRREQAVLEGDSGDKRVGAGGEGTRSAVQLYLALRGGSEDGSCRCIDCACLTEYTYDILRKKSCDPSIPAVGPLTPEQKAGLVHGQLGMWGVWRDSPYCLPGGTNRPPARGRANQNNGGGPAAPGAATPPLTPGAAP